MKRRRTMKPRELESREFLMPERSERRRYERAWRERNREHVQETKKAYYTLHRKKILAYGKDYYRKQRDRTKELEATVVKMQETLAAVTVCKPTIETVDMHAV